MAGPWRIRHKLLLGLALVMGVMALLLTGTLEGLASYRATMNGMESKLVELALAQKFKESVAELDRVDSGASDAQQRHAIRRAAGAAQAALDDYKSAYQQHVARRRAPAEDYYIPEVSTGLQEKLVQFGQAIDAVAYEAGMSPDGVPPSLRRHKKVAPLIDVLVEDSGNLEREIYRQLFDMRSEARRQYTSSSWVVVATSLLSVVLMAGLLRFYYSWVFHPVHDLMQGVDRVARGDFEHTITVKSSDEMQDLAAAFNDMTGRLRDMYRDLARQVNERSRQLVRSERLASVGFLAAGVAHEINNPLASIAFCSEALEARLTEVLTPGARPASRASSDPETVFKYLKMIQEEAFRCKEITGRLLEFSRSGERKREQTDLAELVQSVLDLAKHLQNHKAKHIVFDHPDAVTAWINAQEVKSVVLNLVVNALESMDEGGTLTVRLTQKDGQAEILFRDSGCGMSAEVLDNIFEPFFTQSRTGKGTGLGLTISHRIITGHGGDIEAASPGPNQGSTFTVRLPLRPADDQAGRDAETDEAPELLFRRRQAA